MAIPELKKNADLTSINCMSISHLSLFDEKQQQQKKKQKGFLRED